MTVLEAINKILEFLIKNDSFEFKANMKNIALVHEPADEAATLAALDELVKQGVLIKKDINETAYWVLVKPLALHMQNIVIPLNLAASISELLNDLEPKDPNRSNPVEINAQDILTITLLARKVLTNS